MKASLTTQYGYVNAHKTEYMCYNQTGNISTLDRTSLKVEDKFTYLGSSVSSTEKDIDTRLTKAWTAIGKQSIIWKSDLTDKMKCSFFQAAVVLILLYGCTTWIQTEQLEKLDDNYTRMLRAILNESGRQHPTRHQLYSHLPPIMKTIQVRWTRHAGHCWKSRDVLIVMYSYGPPHMAEQKQDDQLKHTYSSYVRIRDVALKTCWRWWTIWRGGERGSGISVLATQHDDDHYIYIYVYILFGPSFDISICILYIFVYVSIICTSILMHDLKEQYNYKWLATPYQTCNEFIEFIIWYFFRGIPVLL